MGGNAFKSILSESAFPRLTPAVYRVLKARLLSSLQTLYSHVAVPAEAPEKSDYGDLDFVVAYPNTNTNSLVNVRPEVVQKAIGASHMLPMEGNRTSNFAVPVGQGEWAALGHSQDEEVARRDAQDGQIFYQVDIHVCTDKAEWERIVFFHAYGDLGMILGLIVRNNGLAIGTKGLKMPDPPNAPLDLSESFDEIVEFLGLSMETWRAGFATKRQIFEWAGTCRLFDPLRFKSEGQGISKVKPERTMYAEFVNWAVQQQKGLDIPMVNKTQTQQAREEKKQRVRDEALVHFGKKAEFDENNRVRAARMRLKEDFSGTNVRDWTELGEYWKGVKIIMDAVRMRVGGDEGVLKILEEEGVEGLKKVVLEVKNALGIIHKNGYARQQEVVSETDKRDRSYSSERTVA